MMKKRLFLFILGVVLMAQNPAHATSIKYSWSEYDEEDVKKNKEVYFKSAQELYDRACDRLYELPSVDQRDEGILWLKESALKGFVKAQLTMRDLYPRNELEWIGWSVIAARNEPSAPYGVALHQLSEDVFSEKKTESAILNFHTKLLSDQEGYRTLLNEVSEIHKEINALELFLYGFFNFHPTSSGSKK